MEDVAAALSAVRSSTDGHESPAQSHSQHFHFHVPENHFLKVLVTL